MEKKWVITGSGAYMVEEVTNNPLKANNYLIRIRQIGHIMDYYRRVESGRFELQFDLTTSFIIDSDLTKEELEEKAYSYMNLIENDIKSNPDIEEKTSFKKERTLYFTPTFREIQEVYEYLNYNFKTSDGEYLYALGRIRAY